MSNQTHDRTAHCWMDRSEWIEETYGDDSKEYIDDVCRGYYDDEPSAICMLLEGHDGPHEWTSVDDIIVTFKG